MCVCVWGGGGGEEKEKEKEKSLRGHNLHSRDISMRWEAMTETRLSTAKTVDMTDGVSLTVIKAACLRHRLKRCSSKRYVSQMYI